EPTDDTSPPPPVPPRLPKTQNLPPTYSIRILSATTGNITVVPQPGIEIRENKTQSAVDVNNVFTTELQKGEIAITSHQMNPEKDITSSTFILSPSSDSNNNAALRPLLGSETYLSPDAFTEELNKKILQQHIEQTDREKQFGSNQQVVLTGSASEHEIEPVEESKRNVKIYYSLTNFFEPSFSSKAELCSYYTKNDLPDNGNVIKRLGQVYSRK
ncbi:unnamed protein product, partial [Didymodactylos carnosus]